jgi:hypothetical protein
MLQAQLYVQLNEDANDRSPRQRRGLLITFQSALPVLRFGFNFNDLISKFGTTVIIRDPDG